jgi:hypothetical protein
MKNLYLLFAYSINVIELITILIGAYHYKKYKDTILKYFLWFLIYGFATEMSGVFIGNVLKKPSYIVFNIYAIAYYIFNFWLFIKYFKRKSNRKITKVFSAISIVVFIINTVLFQSIFSGNQSYTWFVGGIFSIITIVLFFVELLNSDAILNVKHLLIFWVAVGIFLFQLGFLPVFIATKYINYSNGLTYGYILLILNLITSLCYSLGFIWVKKNLSY